MSTAKNKPTTRRGVTEQAAVAAIDSSTRVLRLPRSGTGSQRSPPPRNANSCPTSACSPNW
jgi:hypothetical protein